MDIVFATNNPHKLQEIRNAVGNLYNICSLSEKHIDVDIPETKNTLEENAIEKAQFIYSRYQLTCFADDTGLEVEALGGRPGVYSARYAGPSCSFDDNINKLLHEMQDIENRNACFRTVIAYIENGEISTFEGIIKGQIINQRKGRGGFGYDPVFRPLLSKLTFAEMTLEEKNKISHRAQALRKFTDFLMNKDKAELS